MVYFSYYEYMNGHGFHTERIYEWEVGCFSIFSSTTIPNFTSSTPLPLWMTPYYRGTNCENDEYTPVNPTYMRTKTKAH
jgi:hypothetical protein